MPKYNVRVSADTTLVATLEVEADTPEQAEELALEQAKADTTMLEWKPVADWPDPDDLFLDGDDDTTTAV